MTEPAGVRRSLRRMPGTDGPREGRRPRSLFYDRLFRVEVRNDFYNATRGVSHDLVPRPTRATSALLASLGLLFRVEPDGFSVLYDTRRTKQLLSFLSREWDARSGGIWTRLSFALSLNNPWFVNFSQLPIDTNPAETSFYLTNVLAHDDGEGVAILPPGSHVTGRERIQLTGGQLVVAVGEDVAAVRILSLSGEAVAEQPRCVPGGPRGEPRCVDRLYFDLSIFPEGVYRVEKVYVNGTREVTASYLYSSLYPAPLCFLDLFFARPAEGAGGVYPVNGILDDPENVEGAAIESVEYRLPFVRRRTWWSYVVVPQPPRTALEDLVIQAPPGAPPLEFLGPCCVRLPGGARAYRFLSPHELPLEQRPTLHLQLLGRASPGGGAEVLIERLPLPSGQQVIPLTPETALQRVAESLCRGPPGPECERLLSLLAPRREHPVEPESPYTREFSDVYVYV